MAHRVISLRCRILSLSGHSGHRSSRTNQARFMSTRPSLSLYDESQTTVKCVTVSADQTKQQPRSASGLRFQSSEVGRTSPSSRSRLRFAWRSHYRQAPRGLGSLCRGRVSFAHVIQRAPLSTASGRQHAAGGCSLKPQAICGRSGISQFPLRACRRRLSWVFKGRKLIVRLVNRTDSSESSATLI
jgi:hypothetical protein